MENSIGNGAIKIACIQTVPGYEADVRYELEKACQATPKVKDFISLKGIGNFDIILLYWTDDFGSHLRKAGPIKKIIKSNMLLCYPYLSLNAKNKFSLMKDNLFTAFCLLKISPGAKKTYPEIDKLIRKHVLLQNEEFSLLGSLGWDELIVLFSSDNIYGVYERLHEIGLLHLPKDGELFSIILKTLSFIGINYRFLPQPNILKKGIKQTQRFLNKRSGLDSPIHRPNKLSISPTIEITARPIYLKEIEDFFKSEGFTVSYLMGKKDIVVKPTKKEVTWSYLFAIVLCFRYKFRDKIFSTNTRIIFENAEQSEIDLKDIPSSISPFEFEYSDLQKIFGDSMSSNLSNQFYTLNSLFQNPLCGSLYADMVQYPRYVYEAGSVLKEKGDDNTQFALVSSYVIGRGAELRSYGTYDTIEEVTGRFSEFKGGCQLSLLAMELLPSLVLEKLGIEWMGFIIIMGEPKFSHINEVISVPSESLWNPRSWWALYHEIAHVIINRKNTLVGEDVPSVSDFLQTTGSDDSYDDLVEFSAEVIGFELGFFGDYDLYFELLWKHLAAIDPFQNVPISSYAIRSFFIDFFEDIFRRRKRNIPLNKRSISNLDLIYKCFIDHMEKIDAVVGKKLILNKHFVAARAVKMFRNLGPFCEHLSKQMDELKVRIHKREKFRKNTKLVTECLNSGRIWWEDIDCPEAILYSLFKDEDINFNTRIATILSLWNQQIRRYGARL